jgi:hypothetical protein
MQNLSLGPECTISGYRSCKVFILLHWNHNDVWECFKKFCYPSARKRCKTCVSGLNTLSRGTEVVKHPFYSIGPKMMFGSVSKHFANLQHVKDANLVFRAWMHYFRVPSCKACILLHWTQNGVWECFRAFRQPSARKKMQNLCFGPECTILGYRSC